MALPILPPRGQDPWYDTRTTWDSAVDSELTGRLSADNVSISGLNASASGDGAIYPAGAALGAITFTALQNAATEAVGTNKRVVAAGSLTTDQTLVLRSDFDLGQLTISYNGTGNCVQLGDDSTPSHRFRGTFPRVMNINKSGTGWSSVAGSVGIYVVNMNSCPELVVPLVQQFEIGLKVYGRNQGNAYNTFLIGHLNNNKINLLVDAEGAGWSNQNTYIGGRFSHNSAEGSSVAGVRNITVTLNGTASGNNNLWLNASIEGEAPEYHLDINGLHNQWFNARFEAITPKVIWRSGAGRNQIFYGYGVHTIVETIETGGTQNQVYGPTSKLTTAFDAGSFVLENPQASTRGVFTVMGAGARLAGSDPLTAYACRATANAWYWKQPTDTFPTVVIDAVAKRLWLGGGVGAATYGIGYHTSGNMLYGHQLFEANRDIGLSTGNKPRNVRATGFFQGGAYTTVLRPTMGANDTWGQIVDTTLGIPIWWNGTTWINAMGTPV